MAIELTDDGTMDTVLRCSDCGQEMRYNYDPSGPDDGESNTLSDAEAYDAFVEWAIEDATADHECASEDEEPSEPQEGDITTEDHQTFYQDGKRILWATLQQGENGDVWFYRADDKGIASLLGSFGDNHVAALRAYMERSQFWPNVWFISDHGNAHLMDLREGQ